MPSNHLILCCPLLFLPLIFSSIKVLSNELALHIRWLKYRSFSVSPSNEYSELISSRIDWRRLKSLLQHHSSEASILWHLAFFIVQLSDSYMTTEKPTALTKNIGLCFLICSLGFLQLSFQGESFNVLAAVTVQSEFRDLENKICHCFHFSCFCLA